MARPARPWFWKERDGWYITLNGRRVRLALGKANRKLAETKFHELMLEVRANPAPDAPEQTVVSVIEAYLGHAQRHLSARYYAEQRALLQRFAEAHGFRQVADCKPFHLQRWHDANPARKSPWTLRRVAATVKRTFQWACRLGWIGGNPSKDISFAEGAPAARSPTRSSRRCCWVRRAGGGAPSARR